MKFTDIETIFYGLSVTKLEGNRIGVYVAREKGICSTRPESPPRQQLKVKTLP